MVTVLHDQGHFCRFLRADAKQLADVVVIQLCHEIRLHVRARCVARNLLNCHRVVGCVSDLHHRLLHSAKLALTQLLHNFEAVWGQFLGWEEFAGCGYVLELGRALGQKIVLFAEVMRFSNEICEGGKVLIKLLCEEMCVCV